jgi:siderophore synthetase component
MLSYRSHADGFSASFKADHIVRRAQQRGLTRMLQALFREELLQASHLIDDGPVTWLPLWSQQGLLRFGGLYIGRTGDCRLDGGITYIASGNPGRPVPTATALLECVASSLPLNGDDASLHRLVTELDNSLQNDILCLTYRESWAARLTDRLPMRGQGFLAALRASVLDNPVLLLEQWGTLGHPWHPNYKTKLGLSPEEVIGLSPEFEAQIEVALLAVNEQCLHIETSTGQQDYRAWFAATFPVAWNKWRDALAARRLASSSWLPVPVHPFQARDFLAREFAAEFASGAMLLLEEATLPATPTMSFRTVVPSGSAGFPQIKLPVALRLTSVQRTVSPKSAVMGPRLSALLRTIVDREAGFGQTLDFLGEDIGLHYKLANDDRARHLAVLFRANPMRKMRPELFPLPVAAMMVDSPHDGHALATELVGLAHGADAAGAAAFFTQYAGTVLRATLSPYLIYGIAFEAHQQNSFVMLNSRWEPVQLLVRDFGDLRIHEPTLRRAGLNLKAYSDRHTLFNDEAPVRDKLLHAVMLCHLGELAILLASTYRSPEALFWDILYEEVDQVFQQLKSRVEPRRWNQERQALLENVWPAKSFVRMRLSDSASDEHRTMPNPLRREPN